MSKGVVRLSPTCSARPGTGARQRPGPLRPLLLLSGALAGSLIAAVTLGSSACGASYQAIYEGEVRFEHCYRLDEDPSVPVAQRRECWREWTRFYTYGQTRDRIEYALMRQRALSGSPNGPEAPVAAQSPDAGLAPTPTLAAPPPTSLFAPPPIVDSASRPSLDAGPPPSAVPSPEDLVDMVTDGNAPPGQMCLLRCVGTWKKCVERCLNNNARCRASCDSAFRACGRGCI
jgi:hypothetical protein